MDFDAGEIEFDDDYDSEPFSEEEYEEEIIEENVERPKESDEEETEEEEDSEDSEEEEEEEEEIQREKIDLDKRIEKVRAYKDKNIQILGKLGTISFLCHVVNFVKRGGAMLDKQTTFEYPYETEESYSIKSILTSSTPFLHVVNNKRVEIDKESLIISMKQVLRPVHDDNKIFFTPALVERFPLFVKNLFNDSVTSEEWDEISNLNGSKKY